MNARIAVHAKQAETGIVVKKSPTVKRYSPRVEQRHILMSKNIVEARKEQDNDEPAHKD